MKRFTGVLRSWWDKYLNETTRQEIQNANFDENMGIGKPDGINTLIYTIIKYFIGTFSEINSRIHDQLTNLTCPTLSDFRWHKDVFTSRVMLRDDCTLSF